MFDFNNKDIRLTKAQLPLLILAFAPFFLHGLDARKLFASVKTVSNVLPITAQAIVDDKAIKLEVSNSKITHQTGLTYRADIAADRGILYQTIEPLSFSGKNMEFATDLIFMMNDKVVSTHTNIKPCTDRCITYSTKERYNAVIEVKTGLVENLRIINGKEIKITYIK
jgi:uncharacterized membrane protein (UPF0127 family)